MPMCQAGLPQVPLVKMPNSDGQFQFIVSLGRQNNGDQNHLTVQNIIK